MDIAIKDRIQKLIELENITPASFAKSIQVNPSAVSHILNGRNKPSTDIIIKILTAFSSINSEWLILGVGSMYKNGNKANITAENDENKTLFASNNDDISNNITPDSQILRSEQPASYGEKEEVAQSSPVVASKIPTKIIVYYSNNSFEEFIPGE